ncbi:crossover junction endodeoxyribonuclease RuvC [Fibrobacter sp. UBA3629]|uniref:crossover junction endodeoxyribonuclease RuvC n=1 Tax=Fibrobacter sp. UBA3629 TaxID=1946530 RepID=UPI0025C01CE6|nr:crossover junction endodeoxyribonuclease RuvC [Fibrobacter sp. UBA3629]
MIILGIDPGSITTGYAFVEKSDGKVRVLEYGVLHAPASHAVEDRLLHIVTDLEALLERYRPDALAMEGVFFAKNAKSALVLGHVRGAVLVACCKRGMTFSEYPPKAVKQAVTGDGSASKEQVANLVFARLGIEPSDLPLDASDALAIAWTHANPSPLSAVLGSRAKRASARKKASAAEWRALVEKMGGTLP